MFQSIQPSFETNIKSKKASTPKLYAKTNPKRYFYTIKFTTSEKSLCKLEMKQLFNKLIHGNHFFSYHYINPHRSPFIKQCISIIYTGDTVENIVKQVINNNLSYKKFKVYCFNTNDEGADFNKRREIENIIGFNINGAADIHNPQVLLGITKVGETWIFGELEQNKSSWKAHNLKPYYYSNALGVNVARALVNLAVGNNLNSKVVDPCCGIGTVIIEALSLEIDIKGFEINPLIGDNAKKNLEYFGFNDVITIRDMHNITEVFDVSIVDLPYGLFSLTTLKEQLDIIKTSRRISQRLVLISMEKMDNYLLLCGFKLVDSCEISKGKFTRYITICK